MSSIRLAFPSADIQVASVAGLRSMRRMLAGCLERAGWPAARVADAQVVLAELATNAFVHDAAPTFAVRVVPVGRDVEMATRHSGVTCPPAAPVAMTTQRTPGGRGLAIVDQLVSEREVESVDGLTTTVVRMSY